MDDPVIKKFLEGVLILKARVKSIYFFGSRARGTERPDSDYDLLLVVSEEFSRSDKDALYDVVMDILFETSKLISLKIFREGRFRKLCDLETPFTANVLKEGVKIG